MTESIVYLVTNRINGKRYIGVTGVGLRLRRYKHEWPELRMRLSEIGKANWARRKAAADQEVRP